MSENHSTKQHTPKDFWGFIDQIEAYGDEYLVKKAPFDLPDNAREFIVKVSPYISLVLAIMLLPFIVLGLGFGAILAPFGMMAGHEYGVMSIVKLVLSAVSVWLWVKAIPGLFKREHKSWKYAFYNGLLSVVQNIFTTNVVGLLLGTLVHMYILFQVKEKYNK